MTLAELVAELDFRAHAAEWHATQRGNRCPADQGLAELCRNTAKALVEAEVENERDAARRAP